MRFFLYHFLAAALVATATYSATAPQPVIAGFNYIEIVKFLPFIAIFYYFLIHQPKKKAKEHQALIEALKKGDTVITNSGIVAVIYAIDAKDTLVTLEIAEGVHIRALKTVITPHKESGNALPSIGKAAPKSSNKSKKAS